MTSRTDHEGSIELSVCCQPRVGWILEPVTHTERKKQRHVREAAGKRRRGKEAKRTRGKQLFCFIFYADFVSMVCMQRTGATEYPE